MSLPLPSLAATRRILAALTCVLVAAGPAPSATAAELGGAASLLQAEQQAQQQAQTAAVPGDSGDAQASEARRLLVHGMTRAYVDDHEAAIRYFERALEMAPDEASILSALAESHAAEDNTTSALFYARQARDRAPANPHYHLELARMQFEAGRTDDAVATYRSMLERFPDHARGRLHLAQTLADADRPQEALSVYETLADQSLSGSAVDPSRVYLDMLQLYRRVDDAQGVERSLKALVELQPTTSLYRELLGEHYVRQNRVGDAITLYEQLLEDRPADVDVVSQLSTLYRQSGTPARADSLLRRYTSEENTTVSQLVARARALYQHAAGSGSSSAQSGDGGGEEAGLMQTATELLREALRRAPENTDALEMLGEIRYDAGAYAEAGDLLERALQQNPKAPKRWTLAASAYLRADRLQDAADLAEEGLLLFPGQYPLVRISAFAHLRLERNRDALARMQEALELLPDDASDAQRASIRAGLGTLHHRLGNDAKARRYWQDALDLDPDQPDVRQKLDALGE